MLLDRPAALRPRVESLPFLAEVVLDILVEVFHSEPQAQTDHLPDHVIEDVFFLCETGDIESRKHATSSYTSLRCVDLMLGSSHTLILSLLDLSTLLLALAVA